MARMNNGGCKVVNAQKRIKYDTKKELNLAYKGLWSKLKQLVLLVSVHFLP